MDHISRVFEWIAVAVLIIAFVLTLILAGRDLAQRTDPRAIYRRVREVFGRGILISLEILVAADLIRTVAVEPTLENIGVLGLIVVVRTLLSFALDVEITGVLPWRRHQPSAADASD